MTTRDLVKLLLDTGDLDKKIVFHSMESDTIGARITTMRYLATYTGSASQVSIGFLEDKIDEGGGCKAASPGASTASIRALYLVR